MRDYGTWPDEKGHYLARQRVPDAALPAPLRGHRKAQYLRLRNPSLPLQVRRKSTWLRYTTSESKASTVVASCQVLLPSRLCRLVCVQHARQRAAARLPAVSLLRPILASGR